MRSACEAARKISILQPLRDRKAGKDFRHLYNPFSSTAGLLANSGHDRLYHSEAFLTTNAEVFVLGSEATVDYTMQIYTPPYLVGTFSR